MSKDRAHVDACAPDGEAPASCLLYLLPVGRDREVVLTVHGTVPGTPELADWLSHRAIVTLTASRQGIEGTFPVTIDFAHVLLARTSLDMMARRASF